MSPPSPILDVAQSSKKGIHYMDRIMGGLLSEFSSEFGCSEMAEDKRFEQFAAYLVTRRHYSESAFDPSDLVTGGGHDTGIDAIAIVVNNNLVTDVDEIDELLEANKYLEVTFVFVQAERTEGFSAAKIGTFGYAVKDFFGQGKLKRNESIDNSAEIMTKIFNLSGKFARGNPSCYMYYVTTGKWQAEHDLVARYTTEVDELLSTNNFSIVDFIPVGADLIQKLYNQTKNKISREFIFAQRTVIPDIANVSEAHLGFLSATEFLKLVCDDNNEIIKSLFYENVRDWQGYNNINTEIRETLSAEGRDRFVLMNNGVTIIAGSLHTTGHRFTMGNFQIVNGCQTSHVLYDNRQLLTEAVRIPLRIICTQDEAVIESVITATNRQTEVKQDQFFALREFAKKLESYFKTFDGGHQLYYERRTHQYDGQPFEKTRIITHPNLVRSVGAMFLAEPHRTTRTYRLLSAKVGKDIFADGDRLEPYYVSAFALYKLEYLFRNGTIPVQFKPARYHLLLLARLIMDAGRLPKMNAHEMGRRCDAMIEILWDKPDGTFVEATEVLKEIVSGNLARDHVRREPVTDAILARYGHGKGGTA